MTHIIMTSNTSWYLANFLERTIRRLIERGDHITVLACEDHKSEALVNMGCTFVPLDLSRKGISIRADVKLLLDFIKIFRDHEPDLVMTFTIKNNIFGAFAARYLAIPVLPTISGLGTVYVKRNLITRLVTLLIRLSMRPLPKIILMNSSDRKLLTGLGAICDRSVVQISSSGIDLNHFSQVPLPVGPTRVFLMHTRLLWHKGVAQLAEASRRLKDEGLDVRCQLLGFVDVDDALAVDQASLDAWDKEGVLEFIGKNDDVRPAITSAHCIVLPSYYREGVPRSLLEGGAMGRPLITTNTPGCRCAVDVEETGFLCKPQDVETLSDCMRQIATMDDRDLAEMGAASRAKMVRKFDDEAVILNYLSSVDYLIRPV